MGGFFSVNYLASRYSPGTAAGPGGAVGREILRMECPVTEEGL